MSWGRSAQEEATISIIHKRVCTGLHRFTEVKKLEHCWAKFIDLLKLNPQWVDFLEDKGGIAVPHKYLVTVEQCLRLWGKDRFAMGTFAMDSPAEWHDIKLKWKKVECYIAFCRYVRGWGSYGKYQHFYWLDYITRGRMRATFVNRHWPYSSGKQRLKGLKDPEEWKNPVSRRHKKRKSRKSRKLKSLQVAVAASVVKSQTEVHSQPELESTKVWDSETEEWVDEVVEVVEVDE